MNCLLLLIILYCCLGGQNNGSCRNWLQTGGCGCARGTVEERRNFDTDCGCARGNVKERRRSDTDCGCARGNVEERRHSDTDCGCAKVIAETRKDCGCNKANVDTRKEYRRENVMVSRECDCTNNSGNMSYSVPPPITKTQFPYLDAEPRTCGCEEKSNS